MTLPTPNQFPAISYKEGVTDKFYATRSELLWDIVKVIKSEIAALVGEQVAYIQSDASRYSYYVDPKWRRHLQELGVFPDDAFDAAVPSDTACLRAVAPAGVTPALSDGRRTDQSTRYP